MERRRWNGITVFGTVLVVTAIVLSLLWASTEEGVEAQSPDTTTTTTTVVREEKCDQEAVVREILVSARFTPEQFTIGEENFDLTLPATLDAGDGAFINEPRTSAKAWAEWVNSNDPAAAALREVTLEPVGGTREMGANPDNWVGFQLLVPSEWSGNTLFVDGRVVPAGTRSSDVGDLGWVFIHPEDCRTRANIVRTAIVRLACGNPQAGPPTPADQPTTTTTPPTPTTVGKHAELSPVSDDPNDECEECRPVTSEPPRETPPTTTNPNPDGGEGPSDSGDGATNTTTPPTTQAPPPTTPDNTGDDNPNSGTVPQE